MDLDNIPQQGKKLIGKMAGAVETTGKQVAEKVSNITEGKTEELTEEAIQTAVDRALDVMQIAGDRVRERNINGERVTLEIEVEILGVTSLKLTTDVPEKSE